MSFNLKYVIAADLTRFAVDSSDASKILKKTSLSFAKSLAIKAAVVLAAGKFFKDAFDEAIEAQEANAKLASILSATGNASGLTLGALNDLSEKIELLTNVEADTVAAGQAILLRFKKLTGETFVRANKIAVDISVVMGKDLTQVSLALGKALQDPADGLKSLGRAGVSLTQGQIKLIESLADSGDLTAAQEKTLSIIEGKFGGVASVMAGGTGAFTGLTLVYKNLAQSVGELFLPEAVALSRYLKDFIGQVEAGQRDLLQIKGYFIGAFSVLSQVIRDVFGLFTAQFGRGIFGGIIETVKKGLVDRPATLGNIAETIATGLGERYGETFGKSIANTYTRSLEFKLAQAKAAKISAKVRPDPRDELEKETQYQADLKRLEDENDALVARSQYTYGQKRVLAEKELTNRILAIQLEGRAIRQQNDRSKAEKDFEQVNLKAIERANLNDQIFEAKVSALETDEKILANLEKSRRKRINEEKIKQRKDELNRQHAFYTEEQKQAELSGQKQESFAIAANNFKLKLDKTSLDFSIQTSGESLEALLQSISNFANYKHKENKALELIIIQVQLDTALAKLTYWWLSKLAQSDFWSAIVYTVIYAVDTSMCIWQYQQAQKNINSARFSKPLATGMDGSGSSFDDPFFAQFSQNEIVIDENLSQVIRSGEKDLIGKAFPRTRRRSNVVRLGVPRDLEPHLEIRVAGAAA